MTEIDNSASDRLALVKRLVTLAERRIAVDDAPVGSAKISYFPLVTREDTGDLRPIHVPFKPTKLEKNAWEAGGYMPVWSQGAPHHKHALIGAGRALAELAAVDLIRQRAEELSRALSVVDVGSNAQRLHAAMRVVGLTDAHATVHHLVPVVQDGDNRRLVAARRGFSVCTCLYQQCTHLAADVQLFQHSLYYMTPSDLLARMPPGCVSYATLHHIFDAAGTIEGNQMAYHVREDGLVECLAAGNTHSYVHPANSWLKSRLYSAGGRTLRWELVESFFSTHLYQFDVTETATVIPRSAVSWSDASTTGDVAHDYLQRINGDLRAAVTDRSLGLTHHPGATTWVHHIEKMTLVYGVAYAYLGRSTVVAIPTDLVGNLVARATGVARDPTLRRSLTELARKYLLAGNYPPHLIPRVILLAVTAAMVRGVEEETARFGRTNSIHQGLFAEHARVLAGGGVSTWRWYHALNPRNWFSLCTCADDEFHSDAALTVLQLRANGVGSAPTEFTPLPQHTFAPAYVRKTIPLPAQDAGTSLVVGPDVDREAAPSSARVALLALGPYLATTANNDLESFEHAFRSRIGRAVPTADPLLWDSLWARIQHPLHPLHGLLVDEFTVTAAIRSAWLDKFPLGQRRPFLEALETLHSRDLTSGDCRTSGFAKVEKSALVGPDGLPALDERLVFSYRPIRQVVTGPVDWTIAKAYRQLFSPNSDSPVVWVNGRQATAEAFGDWFDAAVASVSDAGCRPVFMCGDHSRFEAHRSAASFDFGVRLCLHASADPAYALARRAAAKVRGRAQRHQVEYGARYKLCSGGTETSLDSFQRNVAGLDHAFGHAAWGWLMFAVNGDDWLVVCRERFVIPRDVFHERMAQLGFESSFDVCRTTAEIAFCQTVPYPTGGRTVWGPKIGRVLSRLPFATNASRDDPVGVALGMRVACSHIPFIVDYLDNLLRLASATPVEYQHHLSAVVAHTADDSTFAFIFERYGLTNEDLIDFRRLLATAASLPGILDWAPLGRLIEVDA